MAKNQKNAAKPQSRLPKRVAGMKVPKALRRSASQAAAWMSGPIGREILASALVAAGAALASNKKVRRAVKGGARDAASGAGRLGDSLAGTVSEVMRRVTGGGEAEAKPGSDGPSPAPVRNKGGAARPTEPGVAH